MTDAFKPYGGLATGRAVLGAPTLTVNPPAKTKQQPPKPQAPETQDDAKTSQDHD